ncbi:OsmC family protein [Metallibacterium sp.]|uniref:OsmC family protein n=1 Tax=Metallibacterium sp. TaxID=2940281 RepID=UPI00260E5A8B|nr:OsmC family protein [Metallibacterium sp.]
MSASDELRLHISQVGDYAFRIEFEGTQLEALLTDEPAPLGHDEGPNPSRLLLAAIGNCMAASLVFALRKFKNQPGPITASVRATPERNAEGRWRIARAEIELRLAEPGEKHAQLERILQQFEQFCVVTQSVREGVVVAARVLDSSGKQLHPPPQA